MLLLLGAFCFHAAAAETPQQLYQKAKKAMDMADFELAAGYANEAKAVLGRTNPKLEGLLVQAYLGNEDPVNSLLALERYKMLVGIRGPEQEEAFVLEFQPRVVAALDAAEVAFRKEREEEARRGMLLAERIVEAAESKRNSKRQSNPTQQNFFNRARQSNDLASLNAFKKAFPQSDLVKEADKLIEQAELRIERERQEAAANFLEREKREKPGRYAGHLRTYSRNNRVGLINRNGIPVVGFEFSKLVSYNGGLNFMGIRVSNPSAWIVLDRNGHEAPGWEVPDWLEADSPPFYGGVLPIRMNGNWGLINHAFKWVVPPQFEQIICYGVQPRTLCFKMNGKYGLMDLRGNAVVPPIYDEMINSLDWDDHGRARVVLEGKMYILDRMGNRFTPFFDQVIDFEFDQTGHAIVSDGGLYGVINRQMEQVIPLSYTAIFRDGAYYQVKSAGLWGVCDIEGNLIIPPRYTSRISFDFCFGQLMAIVNANGKVGVLDVSWEEVVPAVYDSIRGFGTGLPNGCMLFWLEQDGKFGLMDQRAVIRVEPQYDQLTLFGIKHGGSFSESDVVVIARQGNASRIVDVDGRDLAGAEFDSIMPAIKPFPYQETSATPAAYTIEAGNFIVRKGEVFGLVDRSGKQLLAPEYDVLISMQDSDASGFLATPVEGNLRNAFGYGLEEGRPRILLLQRDGKFGLADPEGKWTLPAEYSSIGRFYGGLAAVEKDGKWGYVDALGMLRVRPAYDIGGPFQENLAFVQLDGKWGMINSSGEVLIKLEYDSIEGSFRGVIASMDGNSAAFNHDGKQLIKTRYEDLWFLGRGLFCARKGNLWYVLDKQGKQMIAQGFQEIHLGLKDQFQVKKVDRWGVVDSKGNVIVPLKYQHVFPKDNGQVYEAVSWGDKRYKYGANGQYLGPSN